MTRTRREAIAYWTDLAAPAVVAIGGLWAVYTYVGSVATERRQFTISFVDRYQSGDLVDARLDLLTLAGEIQERYPKVRLGAREIGQIHARLSTGSIASPDRAALRIADFFNAAMDCADSRSCDARLM